MGNEWLQPIQERLSKLYPELTTEELNNYNEICQEAMEHGHRLAAKATAGRQLSNSIFQKDKENQAKSETEFQELRAEFPSELKIKYSWVDE